ncbi:Short-chain dehydrogenase TIC 32 A [Cladobotryum mycophilum]|uniref:Short-chain dehydrogenase TIC 32 A n=1 Tax=Cladobotryum mycophilum TaxID=491253 RepID=A0ABR0T477_9HYPO
MPGPYNRETVGTELVADYADLIRGKTVLTTGISPSGLGAKFVETIAAGKPKLLILAGRSPEKNQVTADAITKAHPEVAVRLLQLDLGSFATVRKAGEEVLSWDDVPVIDVLVNNAGIMAVPYKLTEDGWESQFATNHLGHFLFTNLIIDKVLASPSPRVVNVSSGGHQWSWIRHPDPNFDNGETYNRWVAYGQSKTANILFAVSLAEKFAKRGLVAVSLHPGSIATSLVSHLEIDEAILEMRTLSRKMGMVSGWKPIARINVEQGTATHIFGAFDPSLKEYNGSYLDACQVIDPSDDRVRTWALNPIEAARLWKLSEKAVGQEFSY